MSHRADATETIPAVFAGAREYRDDAAALELAQATFNEEALYAVLAGFALDWHKRTGRPAHVLDLCSATGLSALRVARVVPVVSATLVDIDATALRAAAKRFDGLCSVVLSQADAVSFDGGRRYDLVLMNSAYHHIEDERKVPFLLNGRRMLASDGMILVGEHFLPPYRDVREYRASVVTFYSRLLAALADRQEPTDAVNVIRRSGLYGWEGTYEFKVSWPRFRADIKAAKLSVRCRRLVWRCDGPAGSPFAGSAALCVT